MAMMTKSQFQPLDRLALGLMLGLVVLIAVLIGLGDHTIPKVREFNWQNRQVGAEDAAFTLTFNRPMNWAEVEPNLVITPPIEGKVSWSGRRLAYTLLDPIPYGQSYRMDLAQVREADRGMVHRPKTMHPFSGGFQSRDRAFVYLGTDGDEAGRLILMNMTRQQKQVLTPANLIVTDFKPFPYGDRILLAASDRVQGKGQEFNPRLYTVTTGLRVMPPGAERPLGDVTAKLELALDNQDYQILKFDLAADGSRVVVQRAERLAKGAMGPVSLWQFELGQSPTEVETQPGGDFLIAPDSQALVMAQGQGLAVVPLVKRKTESPLDFLPEFGMVLHFSRDGSSAAMVKFNNDFTRSIFLVTNQGTQKEVLKIKGGILDAVFNPNRTQLYCLLTKILDAKNYQEQPYIAVLDLKTTQLTPLLELPIQPNVTMSLSPDGRFLLFDQVIPNPAPDDQSSSTPSGIPVSTGNLWLLSIPNELATPAATTTPPAGQSASPPKIKVEKPEAIATGVTPVWLL